MRKDIIVHIDCHKNSFKEAGQSVAHFLDYLQNNGTIQESEMITDITEEVFPPKDQASAATPVVTHDEFDWDAYEKGLASNWGFFPKK